MVTPIPFYGITTAVYIMHPKIYKKFIDSDDVHAWELVQNDVIKEMIGRKAAVVPSLHCAENFDLLSVYVKEDQSTLDRVLKRAPTFVYVGQLQDVLLKGDMDSSILRHLQTAHKAEENFDTPTRYKVSDLQFGLRKTISIDSEGIEKFVSYLCMPENIGRLVVNRACHPAIRSVQNLYIINEVYTAKQLVVTTCVGADEQIKDFRFRERTPLAFNCVKVRIGKDDVLEDVKDVKTWRRSKWLYDIPMVEYLDIIDDDDDTG